MDLKQIEKLMTAMGRTGIKKLSIKEEGFELELERSDETIDKSLLATSFSEEILAQPIQKTQMAPLAAAHVQKSNGEIKEDVPSHYVTSPMVGTFYTASSPNDPPFVKIGDKIEENSVVCIIEAMKVMNEVKAGIKGIVTEILVKNGEPVEFGTRILRVV